MALRLLVLPCKYKNQSPKVYYNTNDNTWYATAEEVTEEKETTVTYTEEMEMHFYSEGAEPCLVTSEAIDGLTADGTVYGGYAYLLTSEGNNWWTITTKVPVGTFEIYGNMTTAGNWLMKFSNIGTDAEEIYYDYVDNLDCDSTLRITREDLESYSWRY